MNPGEIILSGNLLAAIPMALLAGVASFISPCVLPLVPGYLGFVSGMSNDGRTKTKSRVLLGALLFVLGFSVVFVSFGALFGGLGAVVYASGLQWVQKVLGAFVIFLGLVMIGQFSFMQRTFKIQVSSRLGLISAPLLGIAFGLGWTPCIGPTLAAVLTLASNSGDPAKGALLAFIYALGIGLPFIAIAAGFNWAAKSVGFIKRYIRAFNIAGGALLVILGLLLVTGWWNMLAAWLQNEVFGYFQLTL
ncbi:MAG: cytochrome c biogenesis CcdA family protein [Rhodoluna sp.]